MERIYTLIDKLHQQRLQGSHPAQLLITIQLLHTEILKLQQKNGSLSSKAKVAVTLPVSLNFDEGQGQQMEESFLSQETELEDKKPLPVQQAESVALSIGLMPSFEEITYGLQKPSEEEKSKRNFTTSSQGRQVLNPAFETEVESPTLGQRPSKKEIHESIVEPKESLNDRLKQEKIEVVHVLKEVPIKDLRKGIGINDRFTFVSELFRGDDAMYERSIKTINGFSVLSEAEYWMNRELKFKLGWNDSKEIVQHFYQLVRRRFA